MPQRIARMRIDSVDAAGITASNYVTAGGGTAGLIGFLSQINWFGLAGLMVALIGLVANVYFQIRRDHANGAGIRRPAGIPPGVA